MNKFIRDVIMFTVGAGIGTAVTYKVISAKYEQILQDEIESVKAVFSQKKNDKEDIPVEDTDEEPEAEISEEDAKEDFMEYAKKVKDSGYINYSDISKPEESKPVVLKREEEDSTKPYVIAPEEFGELYDYDTISLTYFKDGVLTDSYDEPIEDIDATVGEDFHTHFGEYEDDSVFIRNDVRKADYEILYDTRTYASVLEAKSYQNNY